MNYDPKMPPQVEEVWHAMRKSALAAGSQAERAFAFLDDDPDGPLWVLCDNWDIKYGSLRYHVNADKWVEAGYEPCDCEPICMEQAKEIALMFFTG